MAKMNILTLFASSVSLLVSLKCDFLWSSGQEQFYLDARLHKPMTHMYDNEHTDCTIKIDGLLIIVGSVDGRIHTNLEVQ